MDRPPNKPQPARGPISEYRAIEFDGTNDYVVLNESAHIIYGKPQRAVWWPLVCALVGTHVCAFVLGMLVALLILGY